MGLFKIFRKSEPEVKKIKIEASDETVADRIVDYVTDLVKDNENIREHIKEINKIRKLPAAKRESAYLPVYLSLEEVILFRKSQLTKEYFSGKALKKQKEFTRGELRKTIRKKFDVDRLDDNFKVLFLDDPEQSLIIYELICQEFVNLMPISLIKSIPEVIPKSAGKKFFRHVRIGKGVLDFSSLNKNIAKKPLTTEEITMQFKKLFDALYDKIVKSKGGDLADELVAEVYDFVETYGYPLNSDALRILPKVTTKDAKAAIARSVIDYVSGLTDRKDMIKPQLEKIKDAEMLVPEQKENLYFDIYVELEKFITEHKPPAVKKAYTVKELRKEVSENIDIKNLEHRFKLLFLEKEGQIIELFILLHDLFLKHVVSFISTDELKKFAGEYVKGTMLDGIAINKEGIDFTVLERNIYSLPKNKLAVAIHDLSRFLLGLYDLAEDIADNKSQKAISNACRVLKERCGHLPVFDDFLRAIPGGILDYEKRTQLSPKAAEEVVVYTAEIFNKQDIGENLKAAEDARKLPLEEQSEAFFNIYLNLQHYIIDQRPAFKGKEITLEGLKERIRKRVNIRDLEDKFQLLFLKQDEMLVKLLGDLIKECVANFIDKKALVDAEREFIKKNRYLRDVEIDDAGNMYFEPFLAKLKTAKADRIKILNSALPRSVLAVYEEAKSILGELQAKKLFETAYSNLQKKYGANLLQILKVIPKGILEAEKFELLGKEEMEKTAKEMAKIDVMKGEFMNIAAHELKTPLVPIIGYLEMLLSDKRLTRDQKEKIRICLSSAKREADLVSDILDISKLEAGSLKLEFETLNLAELLREVAEGLGPAVRQKKLYFKVDIPSRLPLIRGDKRRLTQVISNLINNSTKFTEKGGLTVKAQVQDENILVSVADTGMGIKREDLKKLFTKFFQADTTARRKQGGTGLGLAICKGIVQGHKGKIWVESGGLGKGTAFYFTIPYLLPGEKGKKGKAERPVRKKGKNK